MSQIKKGFKIVRYIEDLNQYFSCSWLVFSKFSLRYFINKKTFRRLTAGPLAVFDTIENTLEFIRDQVIRWRMSDGYRFKVFSCTYKPSTLKQNYLFTSSMGWNLTKLPKGTRLARWVKLEEQYLYI